MTTLSWDQVTAWRMARGHLNRRVSKAKAVQTVSELCGSHAQIMTSVPLTLAARVSKFTDEDVRRAIGKERSLVKTWSMRGTLHVFDSDDLSLYCTAGATRDQYQNPAFLKYFDLTSEDLEAVLEAIPEALDGRSLTRDELSEEILRLTKRPHLAERLRSGWGELLKPAAFRGLLCFGPQEGRSVSFVRPDQWIGHWKEWDTDESLREVFRRFLSAYAPASRAEVARWWGVRPPQAGRVLKTIEDELIEVEVGGSRRWVLEKDLSSLRRAKPPEGVRLLWSFDQLLVMSAPHFEAIVDPEYKPRIYRDRIAVWSLPAVMIDGRVKAAWKLDRKSKYVIARVEPFKKLRRRDLEALEAEVSTVGTALGTEARLEVNGP
jgi:hypothetical protein